MTPVVETVVWVAEESIGHSEGAGATCAPKPVEGVVLPKGLRGVARPARGECAGKWSFVRFETPGYPNARGQGYYVSAADLATTPPKVAWDRVKATGTAWVKQAGERPTLAIPLDDPAWTAPALLSQGELVERLGNHVIRTSTGRELWIDPYYVVDADPLTLATSSGSTELVANRRRFHAGRARHEVVAPLTPLPPAVDLKGTPKGATFAFVLDADALRDPVFDPGWFEPVGHTLEHDCPRPRPFDACGIYTLDYRALGAWWPRDDTEVIAVWDGSALAIQVLDPWGDHLGVTPAWDGRPSPVAP